MFADDVQIYLDCLPSDLNSTVIKLRDDIDYVFRYATLNHLKLNISETKIMILGSPAYINAIDYDGLPDTQVDGILIPFVKEARNLGIMIQSNLS